MSGGVKPLRFRYDTRMSDEDDIDLYGDLEDRKPTARGNGVVKNKESRYEGALSLTDQVDFLRKQVEELTSENKTLKRNMGILYRTAKEEIKRKDTQIEELLQELSVYDAKKGK